jgi:hypothetical protein
MKSIIQLAIAWALATVLPPTCVAATTRGAAGDGKPSISYDVQTGAFGLQPDSNPIGLFQILSASGIFTSNAILPPGGLGLDVNTANEKAWAALPAAAVNANFNLGNIAAPFLTQPFLLNDLTITVSGGLGTENVISDLVILGETSVPFPTITPINLGEVVPSTTIMANLIAAAGPVTWSNLTPSAGNPAIAATLSPQGAFSWDPAGSARGPKGNGVLYSWTATATNLAAQHTAVAITLRLIPEPATLQLMGLAMTIFIAIGGRRGFTNARGANEL